MTNDEIAAKLRKLIQTGEFSHLNSALTLLQSLEVDKKIISNDIQRFVENKLDDQLWLWDASLSDLERVIKLGQEYVSVRWMGRYLRKNADRLYENLPLAMIRTANLPDRAQVHDDLKSALKATMAANVGGLPSSKYRKGMLESPTSKKIDVLLLEWTDELIKVSATQWLLSLGY